MAPNQTPTREHLQHNEDLIQKFAYLRIRLALPMIQKENLEGLETVLNKCELNSDDFVEAIAEAEKLPLSQRQSFMDALKKAAHDVYEKCLKADDDPEEVVALIDLLHLDPQEVCKRAIREGSRQTLKLIIKEKNVAITDQLIEYVTKNGSKDQRKKMLISLIQLRDMNLKNRT